MGDRSHFERPRWRWALLGCAIALAGCASAPPSELKTALDAGDVSEALRVHEADPSARGLRSIAEVVLEREARGDDLASRRRTFAALRGAGTAARHVLWELSQKPGEPAVIAQALRARVQLGDDRAREWLAAMADSDETAVRAAAMAALDPERDAARLGAALAAGFAPVREAALRRLKGSVPDAELRRTVAAVAAADPDATVRATALRVLASDGQAFDLIERRLDDPALPVRLAAVRALIATDHQRALSRLQPLLHGDLSPEGIELARALLSSVGDPPPRAAVELLQRAIASDEQALRLRATTAVSSLPALPAELAASVRTRLGDETLHEARLLLALALPPATPAATRALRALAERDDQVGAQALAELARRGDGQAAGKLTSLLDHEQAAVRALAATVLARDLGRPHEARRALIDPEAVVRIRAAAAILAAG
ncbi:MAG: hypothetical protein PVI30_01620 [Myxococcales bacterium]|jgi:hypothetical protein